MASLPKKGLADMALAIEDEPDGDETAEDDGSYDAVIGELFDAMKSDDQAGFAEAFKAAVMSCK